MKYHELKPQVPGWFGTQGDFEEPVFGPPAVGKLHYNFIHWPQDPLAEDMGASGYIITRTIAEKIHAMNATGVSFDPIDYSISLNMVDDPKRDEHEIPDFVRLKPHGKPGHDDFALSRDNRLVVSDRILSLLAASGVQHCKINAFDPANQAPLAVVTSKRQSGPDDFRN